MYTLESRVRYSECDEHGSLSLLALINYLQDCTTFHSEEIGRGGQYMSRKGQAWLIAAWQIEIARLPRFCEHIAVDTWCHTMGRTLATRNFVVRDEAGEQAVRADSLWFIYDFERQRPVRITQDQMVYLSDEPPLDMPPTERRLPVEGAYVLAPRITVGEMHLDTNRHVNNAQYIGMAVDALAATVGADTSARESDIARICVQYKRQAMLGDVIEPHVHQGADGRANTVDLADSDGDTFSVVRIELR